MKCEKKHKKYYSIGMGSCPECGKRLEGVTPAGVHPRLVGEHAERRTDKGATTDQGQSLRVGETEDGGKLNRLAGKWRKREAEYRKELKSIIESGNPEVAMRMEWAASVFKECASELEAALGSDPRTMSGAGELEECPDCERPNQVYSRGDVLFCHDCDLFWTRGKDRERSVSPQQ